MAKRRTKDEPALWHLDDTGPPDGNYVALAPGALAPLLPVDLPEKLTGLARERVAQRVLAETLAVPLTGLEVRPWRRKSPAWTNAVVADAADLTGWRTRLSDGCQGLLPDYSAVLCIPDVWTIAVDATVRVRLGETDAFTAEEELAAALLAEAPLPKAVLRLGAMSDAVDAVVKDLGVPVFDNLTALEQAGHGRPLPWADSVRGLDLLAPPSAGFDRIRTGLGRWIGPAAAAGLALILWLGSVALETRGLNDRTAAARAATEDMVRAHFVPDGPILDVTAQVTRALAAVVPPALPPTDPLVLFQMAAPVLAGPNVALQAITYQDDTGLVAAVELTDFAALDQLVADLRSGGFIVDELDSAARQAGGVAARLRLVDVEL